MLCDALIQPYPDYACPARYPNLNVKLKKLEITQNKCTRFWLSLDKMHHISEGFKTINWLPIAVFKYVNNACLLLM